MTLSSIIGFRQIFEFHEEQIISLDQGYDFIVIRA